MTLIERLEAKRRDVDEECRDPHANRETYLWWCDLRDVLDEVIVLMKPPMITGLSIDFDSKFNEPGYIVWSKE